ncbi:5-oxoprolinase subunit PxpA [Ferrimicrobium sp.]|uniref:LamB/YcsF family protein n=1 Tax=Ferrimicrobium sp. TaxID=2926050 RepID=UPI002609A1A8|nr:5-oxoprolinase subunit PxpA [Ferrimicrobium sp.]
MSAQIRIDLNCDMGEGFGPYHTATDEELLAYVTSANIACGFHAGDPRTMDTTVALAASRGVAIGAHVSYPDLVGFGRRHLQVSPLELLTDVTFQIGALQAFCQRHGTRISYIKAHGALYNDMAIDATLSKAMASAILEYDPSLPVLTLAGSPSVEILGEAGIATISEGFVDRAYTPEGRLVPRTTPGAVVTDPAVISARGLALASHQPVDDITGDPVMISCESICIHSDSPGAPTLAAAVRTTLEDAGILVTPFR